MKQVAVRKAFVVGLVSILAFAAPAIAAAQASVQTVQLLPLGANNCPVLVTQGIVAHVRDGELHSFDVTVANPTYVAVLGQVGSEGIPFRYMTRFNHGGGFLRHHVDVETARIGTGLPVSLTLLSSPPGSPTCMTVISFTVAADGSVLAPGVVTAPTPTTPSTPAGDTGGTGGAPSAPSKPAALAKPTAQATPTAPVAPTTTETTTGGGVASPIRGLCEGNGAIQLWFLLLAIYVVIAALTALSKPPLAERSMWLPLVLILAPLVLLLGFWLLFPSCRTAGWVPIAGMIIAAASLYVAFRDQHVGIKVIPLPAAKPSANTPVVVSKAADSKTEQKQEQKKAK
jgi:hypothetical protein